MGLRKVTCGARAREHAAQRRGTGATTRAGPGNGGSVASDQGVGFAASSGSRAACTEAWPPHSVRAGALAPGAAREPCLGERRAAARVVDDLSHDALDVAVSLREVLRGVCQRVRDGEAPRLQAGCQPDACLLARSKRNGPRRQPEEQGSRSAWRLCAASAVGASRCALLPTAAAGARARARGRGGRWREQARKRRAAQP